MVLLLVFSLDVEDAAVANMDLLGEMDIQMTVQTPVSMVLKASPELIEVLDSGSTLVLEKVADFLRSQRALGIREADLDSLELKLALRAG